jgi:hypothetical protein
MIRTTGFLYFLVFLVSGCAPSDPSESRYATPIGPLADDYQDKVKADLAHTIGNSEGAIYTFGAAPSIVNLGKRRAGVRYAWYVCGTVNARDPASGYAGAKPFVSVLSHNVVIDREIDTSRAKDCGK